MYFSKALQDDACCLHDLVSLPQDLGQLPDRRQLEVREGFGGLYDQRRQPFSLSDTFLLDPGHMLTQLPQLCWLVPPIVGM
jgi:hypothetical protein